MKYDPDALRARIAAEKKALIVKLSLGIFLAVLLMAIAFLDLTDTLSLICAFAVIPVLWWTLWQFKKLGGAVLFSKELIGENIKEVDASLSRDDQPAVFQKYAWTPNTYQNKRARISSVKGSVYLKLGNGSIAELRGLDQAQLDIYREGDILMKPAGAKFPTVISRDVPEQPCPYCGTVNTAEVPACRNCGLEIVS